MRSKPILSVLLSACLAGCVTIQPMPPKPPRPTLTISDDGCMDAQGWRDMLNYIQALERGYE